MAWEDKEDIVLLWKTFLEGDDKAFAGIYFTFARQLFSYGRKLTSQNEILLDSIQDVFAEMYERRGKPNNNISNPKAYLFIALRNSIIKKLVRLQKYKTEEIEDGKREEFRTDFNFQDQMISSETSQEKRLLLQEAILKLSPGQKEIIFLKFEEGLGYNDISKVMDITVESARKQLYRALVSLRHILDKETIFNFFYTLTKK